MPASKPGSLTPDEVYAVVAFLYYRNGIIEENDVLDAKTPAEGRMPNRNGFVPAVPVYPRKRSPVGTERATAAMTGLLPGKQMPRPLGLNLVVAREFPVRMRTVFGGN